MVKIKVYLAGPYSHADSAVKQQRYEWLTEAAAIMVRDGVESVYSPITHTHPMVCCEAQLPPYTHTYERWLRFDFAFLAHCAALAIVMLPGWEESKGIGAETAYATLAGIPIQYVAPVFKGGHIVDLKAVGPRADQLHTKAWRNM